MILDAGFNKPSPGKGHKNLEHCQVKGIRLPDDINTQTPIPELARAIVSFAPEDGPWNLSWYRIIDKK